MENRDTNIVLNDEAVERFFWYARERHAVYLRRRNGSPRPWTSDPVMDRYRITNVYRELDKTTAWFRENVRDPLRNKPEVLLATVLFRWFNTIRSGETIFKQTVLGSNQTPWETYLSTGSTDAIHDALRAQGAPWVTGAYMIRSPEGMDKLNGILHSFDEFAKSRQPFYSKDIIRGWRAVADECIAGRGKIHLQWVWDWLRRFYGQGDFLAYEVVTDLRFTHLLDKAPDISTWANDGPGAARGANLILRGPERGRKGRLEKATTSETAQVMAALLELSRDIRYWPQEQEDGSPPALASKHLSQLSDVMDTYKQGDWPAWEMREPEMWLCEFAKLERTRLGFGRPRGTYP